MSTLTYATLLMDNSLEGLVKPNQCSYRILKYKEYTDDFYKLFTWISDSDVKAIPYCDCINVSFCLPFAFHLFAANFLPS